jgi:hypothetical protein
MVALSRNSGTAFVSKVSDQKKPQQRGYDMAEVMRLLCGYATATLFYATVTVESSSRRNVP